MILSPGQGRASDVSVPSPSRWNSSFRSLLCPSVHRTRRVRSEAAEGPQVTTRVVEGDRELKVARG